MVAKEDQTLTIPAGFFVDGADFDAEEPFITVSDPEDDDVYKTTKILFPKALAYYLKTHFCGSEGMRGLIRDHERRKVQEAIQVAIGLKE